MALRVSVLLSGSGTTLQNLIDHISSGKLDAELVCVISSREGAYGVERAKQHAISTLVVPRKSAPDFETFNRTIWEELRRHGTELVALAGFMSLLEIPPEFRNRVINVHPALIPAFCGKGMYGHHVHEAVLAYGVKLSGATVHFVDDAYDTGPIILQDTVDVLDDDTPDTLAERVQAKERDLYPKAIQLFAEGRLRVQGRRVHISSR